MNAPLDVIERYRAAFTNGDLDALMDCFAFPLQVLSVAGDEVSITTAQLEQWPGVLARLLGAYERLGVTDCVPVSVDAAEPLRAVSVVRVLWELRREDHEPVYDFTAVYTLARTQGPSRIVAVAHDELPKMQAALQALGPGRPPGSPTRSA